jgi:hypothetical protein
MKLRLGFGIVAALTVALAVGIAFGVWTASRTASGSVNATNLAPPNLYLCEPDGGTCGDDDSGADEVIFEGLEDLTPSSFAEDSLRLRNTGSQDLDILKVTTSVTLGADPGGGCTTTPMIRIGVLSLDFPPIFGADSGDDHAPGFAYSVGLQTFPRAVNDPRYDSSYQSQAVHIAPGEAEDMLVQMILPATSSGCEDSDWNLSISWEAVAAVH